MPTSYTSLLGFALPVTGELNGLWGDVVNNSITQLVEDSVAGSATASVAGGDWTLTTTGSGASNQARCAILIPTGSPGTTRNIIAPSSSKAYIVDNQSDSSVVLKGFATTGVTIASNSAALCAWDGTDFVQVGGGGGGTDSGAIVSFSSNATRSGYILCDGTPALKSSYPNLNGVLEDYMPWTSNLFGSGQLFSSMVWNGSIFCAVAGGQTNSLGSTNNSYTSPDGITWTTRTMPTSSGWSSVVWNGSIFCAVSGSGISASTAGATSPDGITWTARTLPSARWASVAWGASVFCAVAGQSIASTTAITSPDGITWTARTLASSQAWRYVCYGNSLFLASSTTSTDYNTSPDGVTWTSRTLPGVPQTKIVWNGAYFLFIGLVNGLVKACTSTDGISWNVLGQIPLTSLQDVYWNGSIWCGVAQTSPYCVTSTDGNVWVSRITSASLSIISSNGSGFFVGVDGLVPSNRGYSAYFSSFDTTKFEIPRIAPNSVYAFIKG